MLSGASSSGYPGLPPLPPMAPPPRPLQLRGAARQAFPVPMDAGPFFSAKGSMSSGSASAAVPMDASAEGGAEPLEAAEAGPLPGFPSRFGAFGGSASSFMAERRPGGDISEGPSESSTNIEDTEDDFMANIPHIEKFYEQLAAKAKLPERSGAGSQSWVLSLARSYRRLSREKRRRGGLRAALGPQGLGAGLSAASGSGGLPGGLREQCGFSSNTDDSGYEAGYETDADESELSEWECGSAANRQQRHKRKLEALVNLTMKLSVTEQQMHDQEELALDGVRSPPFKTHRALGTQPVGLRLPLPRATQLTPELPESVDAALARALENASMSMMRDVTPADAVESTDMKDV